MLYYFCLRLLFYVVGNKLYFGIHRKDRHIIQGGRKMKKRLISIFLICCLLCTMLPTVAFATEQTGGSQTSAPASIQSVSYTQTNIEADAVGNYGGYGSLRINETYEDDGWSLKSFPKTALIDSTGSYLFPYKETWLR